MIAGAVTSLGPWSWIVFGVLLMGLELLAPGVFFLWLGFAAILTGVADWAFGLSWQASALTFAVLAIVAVFLGRYLTRDRKDAPPDAGLLNRRGQSLVGRTFVLEEAITREDGGRIRVGDSSWRAIGPELPVGASVRVVAVEGTNLVVEAG